IHLTANTAVETMHDAVGANLPGQVNLDCRVDADHSVGPGNQIRIVDVLRRVQFDHRIIVHKIVKALRAEHKSGDNLAGMQGFRFVVDDSTLNQIDHAVGEHFAVNAEIASVTEIAKHRVGNAADTHLKGASIVNQVGDVAGDPLLQQRRFSEANFRQGIIDLDEIGNFGEVNETVAERARHLRVHFGDHDAGDFGSGFGHADFDAKRAKAMFIGRRDVNQRHIYR